MSKMKELAQTIDEGGILGKAAEYIYEGWKVLPLKPHSKDPHLVHLWISSLGAA